MDNTLITKTECAYNKEICYQQNITPIMEKLDKLDEKIGELLVKIAEMPDRIWQKADEKYATKNVEKVVYGMIGLVLTAFVAGLIELVIRTK